MEVDNRSDLLLLVLKEGPILGITKIEKLIFLLLKKAGFDERIKGFDYRPYKIGPFSSEVYDQIELLKDLGLIKEKKIKDLPSGDEAYMEIIDKQTSGGCKVDKTKTKAFLLTEKGKEISNQLFRSLGEKEKEGLEKILNRFGKKPLTKILRYVYKNYEDYTDKSEIKEEILG